MSLLDNINTVRQSQYSVLDSTASVDNKDASSIEAQNRVDEILNSADSDMLNSLGLAIKRRQG